MRSPALDNAAAWMASRSRREQAMIAFLGGLIVIAIVWLAILRPLLDAGASSSPTLRPTRCWATRA